MSFDDAPPAFDLAANNLRNAFYHAICLDLGIVYPNQSYGSPTEFNVTIAEQAWAHCNTNAARMLMGQLSTSRSLKFNNRPYNSLSRIGI